MAVTLVTMFAIGIVVVFFGFVSMFLGRGKRFGVVSIGMIVVGLAITFGALTLSVLTETSLLGF